MVARAENGNAENGNSGRDAARPRISETVMMIESALHRLTELANTGSTEKCKAATDHLLQVLKNPELPGEFRKKGREAIDALMRHAFMKATDLASNAAIHAAMEDDGEGRAAHIRDALENLRGAVKYKAPRAFQTKCERLLETAMLTGGVKTRGPSRAKPGDIPPEAAETAGAATDANQPGGGKTGGDGTGKNGTSPHEGPAEAGATDKTEPGGADTGAGMAAFPTPEEPADRITVPGT